MEKGLENQKLSEAITNFKNHLLLTKTFDQKFAVQKIGKLSNDDLRVSILIITKSIFHETVSFLISTTTTTTISNISYNNAINSKAVKIMWGQNQSCV